METCEHPLAKRFVSEPDPVTKIVTWMCGGCGATFNSAGQGDLSMWGAPANECFELTS
jgi:hypothetical protein